jgi:Na+-transporting NADH:ubiquinone oxidoreductase subunit C
MAKEHPLKPFYSVLVLAFACSALVAAAAVGLEPYQTANKTLNQKKNILNAAGLYQPGMGVEEQFSSIETRLVDLDTGTFVDDPGLDPFDFDQLDAAMSDENGRELDPDTDIAGLRRQEKYSLVYLVKDGDSLEQVVLPVRGKGLWSTLYAYVAVDSDLNTIRGVSFYEHGETPGLGGEVENPRWQKGWQDKSLYDQSDQLALSVVKSGTQASPEEQSYQIDGLSGATITTQGVDSMMQFWFGDHGFKPFFEQLKNGGLNG